MAMHVRATAQAYIDDFNIALATGNVTKIEALTSPTCGCRVLVNRIKKMTADGQRFDGIAFTLKSVDVTYLSAGASGNVRYSVSAGRVLDVAGTDLGPLSAIPDVDNDLFIISRDGNWMVQQSTLLGATNQ